MDIKLIEKKLNELENHESSDTKSAQTLSLARLLIQSVIQDLKENPGIAGTSSYAAGIGAALLLDQLLQTISSSCDLKADYKAALQKIDELNARCRERTQQYEQLLEDTKKAHAQLLEKQKELEEIERKIKEIPQKIKHLQELDEKGRQEVLELEQKLAEKRLETERLKKEYHAAKVRLTQELAALNTECLKWQQAKKNVIEAEGENSRIIQMMPADFGARSVNDMISALKASTKAMQEDPLEKSLKMVLEEIEKYNSDPDLWLQTPHE